MTLKGGQLFELNLSACFFELLLEAFGISLRETFLEYRGSTVNHFLSFLEAKTGELLNELNNGELRSTGRLEDYVKSSLFFSGGSTGSGTGCNSYSSSCGFDTIFFLEDLSEFVYFLNGEVNKLFCKSF